MNSLTRETREADRGQAEQFVMPPASVTEIADGYMLEIEMPGVKKDGLDISVQNNELAIVGQRSLPPVEGTLVHRESRSENFRRRPRALSSRPFFVTPGRSRSLLCLANDRLRRT